MLTGRGDLWHIVPDSTAKQDEVFEAYQLAAIRTGEALFERKPLNQASRTHSEQVKELMPDDGCVCLPPERDSPDQV